MMSAVARPIPLAAAVMIATRSVKRMVSSSRLLVLLVIPAEFTLSALGGGKGGVRWGMPERSPAPTSPSPSLRHGPPPSPPKGRRGDACMLPIATASFALSEAAAKGPAIGLGFGGAAWLG